MLAEYFEKHATYRRRFRLDAGILHVETIKRGELRLEEAFPLESIDSRFSTAYQKNEDRLPPIVLFSLICLGGVGYLVLNYEATQVSGYIALIFFVILVPFWRYYKHERKYLYFKNVAGVYQFGIGDHEKDDGQFHSFVKALVAEIERTKSRESGSGAPSEDS